MAASSSKRAFPFSDAGDDDGKPQEKKVRFPKKKKAKQSWDAFGAGAGDEGDAAGKAAASSAAKERARRRRQIAEGNLGVDVAPDDCEVLYEDDPKFDDEDSVELEPFNLDQERKEGYFDDQGNFVEYVREREVKDAWLDSVQVDTKLAKKLKEKKDSEEDYKDLSSDDIGRIKRRIADILEPGENIIEALKRLKGSSNDKRGRMSDGTKLVFDELTEAAMTLMENGEYNVYHDDRETFEREADGFEKLARARQGGILEEGVLSDDWDEGRASSSIFNKEVVPSSSNAANPASNVDKADLDMFGDDDDADRQPDSKTAPAAVSDDHKQDSVPALGNDDSVVTTDGGLSSDYVHDPSSGYYYSSSTGYFYDPATGYYCFASTGIWYSYDEQSGTYKEIENTVPEELPPSEA